MHARAIGASAEDQTQKHAPPHVGDGIHEVSPCLKPALKAMLFDNLQERLGIPLGVIDRVVRVFRSSEVFEILREIANHSLVERTKVGGRIPEGVLGQKVMEIPIDELPVIASVKTYKYGFVISGFSFNPLSKLLHHIRRRLSLLR
jgi:hypothetical protein